MLKLCMHCIDTSDVYAKLLEISTFWNLQIDNIIGRLSSICRGMAKNFFQI